MSSVNEGVHASRGPRLRGPLGRVTEERREWDLNPRNPEAQRFSRPSDSAALASLREGSLGLRR